MLLYFLVGNSLKYRTFRLCIGKHYTPGKAHNIDVLLKWLIASAEWKLSSAFLAKSPRRTVWSIAFNIGDCCTNKLMITLDVQENVFVWKTVLLLATGWWITNPVNGWNIVAVFFVCFFCLCHAIIQDSIEFTHTAYH